jgi:putative transposase
MSATTDETNKSKRLERASVHRALRKGRVSMPGHVYLLTTTTLFRRTIFNDFEAARAVASVHQMKWVWRDSQCLAWVLMPDHWHGLIMLGENDQLHTLMGRFKMASSKNVNDKHKTNGWLWARGYHDHALRSDEAFRDAGRYLVANPLRAKLVDHVGMYPYWDAIWLDPQNPHSALG